MEVQVTIGLCGLFYNDPHHFLHQNHLHSGTRALWCVGQLGIQYHFGTILCPILKSEVAAGLSLDSLILEGVKSNGEFIDRPVLCLDSRENCIYFVKMPLMSVPPL